MRLRPRRSWLLGAVFLTTTLALLGDSPAGPVYAFGLDARGFLIEELNERLMAGVPPPSARPTHVDGFEAATEKNLVAFRQAAGLPEGKPVATAEDFAKLGLSWPSEAARALQLIDAYEGTLFKLEGPHESGDGKPMVTYGLIGFTSHDLSLQRFLWKANQRLQGKVVTKVGEQLGVEQKRSFEQLIAAGSKAGGALSPREIAESNRQFVKWALNSPLGGPKPEVNKVFGSFKDIPNFPSVQLELAKEKAWDNEAVAVYLPKSFPGETSVSPKAMLFLLDMTVLTNGPGKEAWARLSKKTFRTEEERMAQIRDEMAVTPLYSKKKRDDIVERENSIITGRGLVHGDPYDLAAYALVPLSQSAR
jgi:hypothetical protein